MKDATRSAETLGDDPESIEFNVRKEGEHDFVNLRLKGVRCVGCLNAIQKNVEKLPGVVDLDLNLTHSRMAVRWDARQTPLASILEKIEKAGFGFVPVEPETKDDGKDAEHANRLIRLATAVFLTMNLMLVSVALWAGFFSGMERRFAELFHYLSWFLTTPVVFYSGWDFLKGSWYAVRNRNLNMDFQIGFNALLIYFYSIYLVLTGDGRTYFESAAMFVTFILASKHFESASLKRMRSMLRVLNLKYPRFGRRIGEGEPNAVIKTEAIRPGMKLEILPGDAVPVDGTVLEGSASLDESSLTGEYLPKVKNPSDPVFSGTFAVNGKLAILATKKADRSTFHQLAAMLESALAEKKRDRPKVSFLQRHFTNLIAVLALATFAGWYGYGNDFNEAPAQRRRRFHHRLPLRFGFGDPSGQAERTQGVPGLENPGQIGGKFPLGRAYRRCRVRQNGYPHRRETPGFGAMGSRGVRSGSVSLARQELEPPPSRKRLPKSWKGTNETKPNQAP